MNRSISILALLTLLGTGCQQFQHTGDEFGELTNRVIDLVTGNTPRNAAVMMENQEFADQRRSGIVQLSNRKFGRTEPYIARYKQIGATDTDWLVRATAIRALNRSRDSQATPLFITALSDPNESVRLEGCKALANVPDEKAVPDLLKLLGDANQPKDVRIAAADALRNYRSVEVARTLITQLSGRDFGLAWQSRRSLTELTGRDLRYDDAAWLNFITGPDKPLG